MSIVNAAGEKTLVAASEMRRTGLIDPRDKPVLRGRMWAAYRSLKFSVREIAFIFNYAESTVYADLHALKLKQEADRSRDDAED